MEIRATHRSDFGAVDALLARSYPVLMKADYPPSVLVTALPRISRARPELVTCGTYYGVFDGDELVGAGGWTFEDPLGGEAKPEIGHIRHLVVDHRRIREGIARVLMRHIDREASLSGVSAFRAYSTRTAVPFYQSCGFVAISEINVPLGPGTVFPAISMVRELS